MNGGLVPIEDAAVEVGDQDGVLGLVEQRRFFAVVAFAFAQRCLGGIAGIDILLERAVGFFQLFGAGFQFADQRFAV